MTTAAKPEPTAADPAAPAPGSMEEAFAKAREALLPPEGAKPEEKKPEGEGAAAEGEGAAPAEGAEGEAPAEGEEGKPAEGEPAAEGEGEGAPAEGAAGEGEEIIVELPGRRPGEKPIPVAISDPDAAERLRQTINDGLRRTEFNNLKANVDRQREEYELFEQHLQIDPVGFLVERVNPSVQVELAKHLLSIPAVFEEVNKELEAWQDPAEMRARQAELSEARTKGRADAEKKLGVLEAVRRQSKIVKDTVESVVPADMAEDEAGLFRDDCLADVANYARAHPEVQRLRPEEVIDIIGRRLRLYGVDPKQALAVLSSGQPFRRPTAASPTKAPAPGTPDAEAARTAGAKLKAAGEQRRAAAAVPGAGAGAQPTKLEPPPKQSVQERIAWLRKLVKT